MGGYIIGQGAGPLKSICLVYRVGSDTGAESAKLGIKLAGMAHHRLNLGCNYPAQFFQGMNFDQLDPVGVARYRAEAVYPDPANTLNTNFSTGIAFALFLNGGNFDQRTDRIKLIDIGAAFGNLVAFALRGYYNSALIMGLGFFQGYLRTAANYQFNWNSWEDHDIL
jgi:hypothetical protein